MASPRTRRLLIDAESMQRRFAAWPLIEISGHSGIPPEIYRVTYHVKGLYVDPSGQIVERDSHLLEINLSLGYPRRAPQCRMLTSVFHPNFDDSSVCIGDFWAASEGLDDLVIRIGRMISYQEYNTKSPLNGLAAKWADQNSQLLPIDNRAIAPPIQTVEEPEEQQPVMQKQETIQSELPVPPPVQTVVPEETEQSSDPWGEKIVIETLG